MNLANEFEKYAVKHRGISSNTLNDYNKHVVTNLTPNIIEERPMNVAVMDVYSRLMMDRIIFLGYPINEEVANIITAQLLFLDSTDRHRDIQIGCNVIFQHHEVDVGIHPEVLLQVIGEQRVLVTGHQLGAKAGAMVQVAQQPQW